MSKKFSTKIKMKPKISNEAELIKNLEESTIKATQEKISEKFGETTLSPDNTISTQIEFNDLFSKKFLNTFVNSSIEFNNFNDFLKYVNVESAEIWANTPHDDLDKIIKEFTKLDTWNDFITQAAIFKFSE